MMEEEDTILFTAPATPRQRTASQLAALRAQVAELRQRLAASPSALLDDTDSEDSDASSVSSISSDSTISSSSSDSSAADPGRETTRRASPPVAHRRELSDADADEPQTFGWGAGDALSSSNARAAAGWGSSDGGGSFDADASRGWQADGDAVGFAHIEQERIDARWERGAAGASVVKAADLATAGWGDDAYSSAPRPTGGWGSGGGSSGGGGGGGVAHDAPAAAAQRATFSYREQAFAGVVLTVLLGANASAELSLDDVARALRTAAVAPKPCRTLKLSLKRCIDGDYVAFRQDAARCFVALTAAGRPRRLATNVTARHAALPPTPSDWPSVFAPGAHCAPTCAATACLRACVLCAGRVRARAGGAEAGAPRDLLRAWQRGVPGWRGRRRPRRRRHGR